MPDRLTLHQDVATTPGRTYYWSFAHAARTGPETATFEAGPPPGAPGPRAVVLATASSVPASGWTVYSGNFTVPSGQAVTRLTLQPHNCYFSGTRGKSGVGYPPM